MKKLFTLLLAFGTLYACNTQLPEGHYRITGKITGAEEGSYAYLSHGRQTDSALLKNGKFIFQNLLADADFFHLRIGKKSMSQNIFLQAGEVAVSGRPDSLSIQGEGVKDWDEYMSKLQHIYDGMGENARKSHKQNMTEEEKAALSDEFRRLEAEGKVLIREFITTHPNSALSPWLIGNFFSRGDATAEIPTLYNGLSDAAKQSLYGKELKEEIDAAEQVKTGAAAPSFTIVDKDGKDISLSDYRGKYLIIDFWGSWCNPCRRSHPHLVELYKKYKNQNFDILGLAGRDKDREKWLTAIKEDGLIWKHANLEENKEKQDVGALYNIKGYPTKILIDPNGVILAYCLGGSEEIDTKLKEIFGK